MDVSREGGFLHRSVFGGAASVNDPMYSGTTSLGTLRAVKDELAGGISNCDRPNFDMPVRGVRFPAPLSLSSQHHKYSSQACSAICNKYNVRAAFLDSAVVPAHGSL